MRTSWRVLICLAISLAYLPFLNSRVLPTAGDDKVYVSQSLEMKEAGTLFVQTLFGEPNYFKGPLQYLLIQAGQSLFGLKPLALVYMNFLLLVITGLAIGTVVGRHVPTEKKASLALWAGLGCAFSAGTIGHVFASQMDIQLLCLYSLAMMFLDRSKQPLHDLGFWLCAGLIGWSKSPLHSGLLGISYCLYWVFMGAIHGKDVLKSKILNTRSWLFCFLGIALCLSGYLPAILNDWHNFNENYLLRETFSKSDGNGGPIWQSWLPLFFYYLFPWNWLALVLYALGIKGIWRNRTRLKEFTRSAEASAWALVIAITAPILIFFCIHPYRGENYTYPAQGAVFVLLALIWAKNPSSRSIRWISWPTALQLLVPGALLAWMVLPHRPDWLPVYEPGLILALAVLSAVGVLLSMLRRPQREGQSALAITPFVMCMALILLHLGTWELKGLQKYLAESGDQPSGHLCYLNLDKNIWNESGTLSFALGRRVAACTTEIKALEHLRMGGTLIVQSKEALEGLRKNAEFQSLSLTESPWQRWGRHAHIPKNGGKSPLLEVRETGNWSLLQRQLVLVRKTGSI